jgi:hypothetical protein
MSEEEFEMLMLVSGLLSLAVWILGMIINIGPGIHMFLVVAAVLVPMGLVKVAHPAPRLARVSGATARSARRPRRRG